jgi:hypothetical protein
MEQKQNSHTSHSSHNSHSALDDRANSLSAFGGEGRGEVAPSTFNVQPATDRAFRLRKDYGVWELTYGSQRAVLKHEIGLEYVAFLLAHPNEEFHGLELALKVRAAREGAPDREDLIQERALALDDAEASRSLYRKQLELEALVDDEDTIDPVRDEAYAQLKDIYAFQKKSLSRTKTQAAKASDSVGKAIKRLHKRLAAALDLNGQPNQLLRTFAHDIGDYILAPSGRGTTGGARVRGCGGHFYYQAAA